MRDLAHNIGAFVALAPAVVSATGPSAGVDLLGFDSVAFIIPTGAIAGAGNFTAKVQSSDTDEDANYADVPANLLQGALPSVLVQNDAAKVGYRGHKRWVRIVITKNSGTSIIAGVLAIKGNAASKPVA